MSPLRLESSRPAIAVLLMACLGATGAVAAPRSASDVGRAPLRSAPPSIRYGALLAHADTLAVRGRSAYGAYVDSLIAAARAGRDSDLVMAVSIERASVRAYFQGALEEGEAEALRWMARAQAARDTLLWCRALRTLTYAELVRQRYPESRARCAEMLRLARRAHLAAMEGYALIGTGYLSIQAGRARDAERSYRRAVRLLAASGDRTSERTAHAGLANSLLHQSRPEEARREYEAVLAEARSAGDLRNSADALNDLGAIEFEYGDPSRAAALYRQSADLQRGLGHLASALTSEYNVAQCLGALGRSAEAAALCDSLAAAASAIGARDVLSSALIHLAHLRRRDGRLPEAERLALRAVAMGDSISTNNWSSAAAELALARVAAGRGAEAKGDLEKALAPGRFKAFDQTVLLGALGRAMLAAHEPDSAIATLRQAAALQRGFRGALGASLIASERTLGRAFLESGQRDSAIAHYRAAAMAWEQSRSQPTDLAWREAFGGAAAALYGDYVAALLDPALGGTESSRAAAAFAAVQPFRARTLEDMLRGAEARTGIARVSLATLRSNLRPGELFLDLYVSPDTSFLFAVSRGALRVTGLPAEPRLAPRLRRFHDLLAAAGSDAQLVRGAAEALGLELFGPIADLIRDAPTVLLSAGRESQYPLGMLRLPGDPEPLAVMHGWAIVPSATLLADARSASSAGERAAGVLALCRTTADDGRRLEGVARESRWLTRTYPDAEVRENDGRRSLEDMLQRLGRRQVLHLAAHARGSAAAPWRAGFLLGQGDGEDAYLTVSRISKLPRPARICVLAGCESAGTSEISEAMPSLASAWLASGASAVIASLWPVGDAATAAFVERFYRALTRGRTTGEALAEAQRPMSAGRGPARDWAGFVLIGDPETRIAPAAGGVK